MLTIRNSEVLLEQDATNQNAKDYMFGRYESEITQSRVLGTTQKDDVILTVRERQPHQKSSLL